MSFDCGSGDGTVFSSDDRFIEEYGLCFEKLPLGFGDRPPAFCWTSLAAAAGFGEPAAAYAVNGLRNILFVFCGVGLVAPEFDPDVLDMLPPFCIVNGLAFRLPGWKLSSRTWTKFEGNSPTIRLSLLNRPIHHDPSPALRHSIRSPSMKPRSRLVFDGVSKHLY